MVNPEPIEPQLVVGPDEDFRNSFAEMAQPPVEEGARMPSTLRSAAIRSLSVLLVVLPLWFGAVHPTAAYLSEFIVFALTFWLLMRGRAAVADAFSSERDRSTSRLAVFCLGALFLYALLQTFALYVQGVPHPVVGKASLLPNAQISLAALRQVLFFVCTFLLARAAFSTSPGTAHRFVNLCLVAGVGVCLVALMHWFADNGRLFWVFAPDYVHVSERARWPFVNPNHLAAYLLPVLFLLLARVSEHIYSLQFLREQKGALQVSSVSLFLSSRTFQRRALRLSILLTCLLAVAVALIGAQSRGAWLGAAVALAFFLVGTRFLPFKKVIPLTPANTEDDPSGWPSRGAPSKRRSHRHGPARPSLLDRYSSYFVSAVKPALYLCAVMLLFFFLNQRGADLLVERIDFGLTHSKDDLRWQFYLDTLPMLRDHLFFGIGLGSWNDLYPHYMNAMLAGITPGYLHSDPYQLLVELGLIGLIPSMLLGIVLTVRGLSRICHAPAEEGVRILGLLAGAAALLVASLLDFPFRIPAITFSFAIYLALTVFYIDRAGTRKE